MEQDECWECSSHDVTHKDDEMTCHNCNGVYTE